MRRAFQIAGLTMAVAMAAGACHSPTKPSGNPNLLSAQLLAAAVVPPVTNSEAPGTGFANITLELVRDNTGTITSAAVDFQVTLANLPPGTTLTEAHLHLGATGEIGPVVVDTGLVRGEVTIAAGVGTFTRQGVSIPTTVAQELYTSPGDFYFDVHSDRNLSGMVRGQVSR